LDIICIIISIAALGIAAIVFKAMLNYRRKLYISQLKLKKDNKRKIKSVEPYHLFDIFKPNEFGVSMTAEASLVMKGQNIVIGATSDYEGWILSVMSKKAERIFEFGTCTGKTTYLMARNSPNSAKVITLTLPPNYSPEYEHNENDSASAKDNAIKESKFERFIYSGTDVENKVIQLFADSKKLDESQYLSSMDLIFIDGSHAYSYIKSDTEKAMKMLKPGGAIFWHDYRSFDPDSIDVCKYLDELSLEKELFHINGTCLIVYKG